MSEFDDDVVGDPSQGEPGTESGRSPEDQEQERRRILCELQEREAQNKLKPFWAKVFRKRDEWDPSHTEYVPAVQIEQLADLLNRNERGTALTALRVCCRYCKSESMPSFNGRVNNLEQWVHEIFVPTATPGPTFLDKLASRFGYSKPATELPPTSLLILCPGSGIIEQWRLIPLPTTGTDVNPGAYPDAYESAYFDPAEPATNFPESIGERPQRIP